MRILPGEQVRLSAVPLRANDKLCLERILLSSPMTVSPLRDWIVNDVLIGGVSQLTQKDLPATLFTSVGVTTSGSSTFTFEGLVDVIDIDHELTIVLTYVGQPFEGGPIAAIFAMAWCIPPLSPSSQIIIHSAPIHDAATIVIRPSQRFRIIDFRIDAEVPNAPAEWLIRDLRIAGRSQFNPGWLPGDMFTIGAKQEGVDLFRLADICPPGGTIEIDVQYVGARSEEGMPFSARFEGAPGMRPEATIETIVKASHTHTDMEIL